MSEQDRAAYWVAVERVVRVRREYWIRPGVETAVDLVHAERALARVPLPSPAATTEDRQ